MVQQTTDKPCLGGINEFSADCERCEVREDCVLEARKNEMLWRN